MQNLATVSEVAEFYHCNKYKEFFSSEHLKKKLRREKKTPRHTAVDTSHVTSQHQDTIMTSSSLFGKQSVMTSAHAHLSHVEAQRRYCNGVATGEEMEIHHRQKRDQRDGSSDARATPTNGDVIAPIPYPLLQTPLLTRFYTNVFCASPVINNS